MFSTPAGRLSLTESAGFGRLVVVTLHRGHTYGSLQDIKEELSGRVMELAPSDMANKGRVSFWRTYEENSFSFALFLSLSLSLSLALSLSLSVSPLSLSLSLSLSHSHVRTYIQGFYCCSWKAIRFVTKDRSSSKRFIFNVFSVMEAKVNSVETKRSH